MSEHEYDVAVVGGGPAGSFVSGSLAQRGFKVALLEREPFPRFHIGESLLPQSLSVLNRAGIMSRVEASGFVRKNGAAFLRSDGSRAVRFDFAEAVPTSEYPHAYQVERRHFDKLLFDWACDQGAEHHQVSVDKIAMRDAKGSATIHAGGTTFRSRFVVDACGLESETGGKLGWASEPMVKDRAALFGHFRLAKDPLQGVGGAVVGDILIVENAAIWFWFIPLKGGHTSVGFVIPIAELTRLPAGEPEEKFANVVRSMPAVEARLEGAERLSPIRGARSYGRANGRLFSNGLVLAGDAAGFLDPVFSSGVCVALCSAEALAESLALAIVDPSSETAELEKYERRVRRALHSMGPFVETWYDGTLKRVFFNPKQSARVRAHVTSLLAGELWNEENPIVREGATWVRAVDTLMDEA